MAAYGGLDRFGGRSTVKTWLTGILKNKVLDALRRREREPIQASALQAELEVSDIDEFFQLCTSSSAVASSKIASTS